MSFKDIVGHPDYVRMLKTAEEMCPSIPAWDGKEESIEDWKRKSAMRDGFELAMQIFCTGWKPK